MPTDTTWDVLQEQADLSEFATAFESNDLVDLINGAQPVTVLAIDNDSMPDQVTADELRDQILDESLTVAQLEQRRSVMTVSDTLVDGQRRPADGRRRDGRRDHACARSSQRLHHPRRRVDGATFVTARTG